ncbi:LIP-domain-containing protein [Daldinia eschscholtzii]|nr:LIP-domain-containing protein [Daldinia eschscholtzii]
MDSTLQQIKQTTPSWDAEHELASLSRPAQGSGGTSVRPLSWLFGLREVPQSSGSSTFHETSEPLPPSKDPWYKAPEGFESREPGTILRIRPTPGNLGAFIGNSSASYNILFRTTDSRYRPAWAVTTLIVPKSVYVSPRGRKALLSYQFAYNTANLDSSPSYTLNQEQMQSNIDLGIQSNTSLLTELLGQGWIVNTPDFQGPHAAFGASVLAGHATLDSIRAVLNLARLTGDADITTAMWGYSGGSIPTEAAAELQVQYAPELGISGVVVGGLVDHLADNMDMLNKSPIAVSLVSALLGLSSQYPEAAAYVRSRLRPETASEFLSARDVDSGASLRKFAMKDIYSYFLGGREDLRNPVLRKVFDVEGRRGLHGVPDMPMFVYKAVGDEFCPVDLTDRLVERFCGLGADVTYERNTLGGHVSEIANGKGRAVKWLWRIFDESYVPAAEGGVIRDVAVNVYAQET